jgi:hypothetical protein
LRHTNKRLIAAFSTCKIDPPLGLRHALIILKGFDKMIRKNEMKLKVGVHFVRKELWSEDGDLVSETVDEVLSKSQFAPTSFQYRIEITGQANFF